MLGRRQVEFDVLMQWVHVLRARWWPGPTFSHRDLYPAEGRNVITIGALLRQDWDDLLWVDSDHLPSPAFIERIEEYPDECEIVGGAYFGREPPYDLQAWLGNPEEEGLLKIDPGVVEAMLNRPFLYPVGGVGTGWMLIRRPVLERMQAAKPAGEIWEIKGLTLELAEKLGLGLVIGEDVMFCIQVKELLDVQVYLDTDARIESGHMSVERIGRQHWFRHHVAAPLGPPPPAPPGSHWEARGGNRAQRRRLSKGRAR